MRLVMVSFKTDLANSCGKTMENIKDDFHTDFEPYAGRREASSFTANL
jgi:cobalamin biosynthesis Co2+ chelatase CbiK